MTIYMKQGISVSLSEPEDIETGKWLPVSTPDGTIPIITVLSSDIGLVRYHGRSDGSLVIFPYSSKPSVVTLHDLPDTTIRLKLLHSVFIKLLDFDGGRLSNRCRNNAIIIIRSLLPDVIRFPFETLSFYLYKNALSVYKDKLLQTKLTHFTLFSRNIKESLS